MRKQYSCIMQKIKINSISIIYPNCWNDLTKDQLLFIVRIFKLKYDDLEFKIRTAFYLLNIKVSSGDSTFRAPDVLHMIQLHNADPLYISNQQILFIANSISFLTHTYTDEKDKQFLSLNSSLTINKIPSFKHKGKLYYGAGENLFNITFDEYLEADNHFMNFLKSNEEIHLNKLIASLYRPMSKNYKHNSADSTGDNRQPFNSNIIDYNADIFNSLDPDYKIAISLFYNGCRQFISNNFKNVFNTKSKTKKPSNELPASLALVDALTNDDVTKNDLVRKSLLYDVLVRLERASIQNQEAQANADKLKH